MKFFEKVRWVNDVSFILSFFLKKVNKLRHPIENKNPILINFMPVKKTFDPKMDNLKFLKVDIKNKFYINYNKTQKSSLAEIDKILSSKNLSLNQKQELLESLNAPFESNIKKLVHGIHPKLKEFVDSIDKNFFLCENEEDLYRYILGNEKARYKALSNENKTAFTFLLMYIKLCKINSESPSLAIIFYFSKILRKEINQKDKVFSGNQYEKNHLYFLGIVEELNQTSFDLSKTSVIMNVSKELIAHILLAGKLYFYKTKEAQVNPDSLSILMDISVLMDGEEGHFALLIAEILEKSGIIEESLAYIDEESSNKSKIYKLSEESIEIFFSLQSYNLVIPMICEPRDWEKNEKGGMKSGGFLMNKMQVSSGMFIQSGKSVVHLSDKRIIVNNKLQRQIFYVNDEALKYVKDNLIFYQIQYLNMSIEDWEECFYIEDENLVMYSEKDYIKLSIEKINTDLNSDLLTDLDKRTLKSKRKRIINNCLIKYKSILSCLLKFEYIIELSGLLKGYKLYFVVGECGRGRFYYVGYGLFPQGDALAKLLLNMDIGGVAKERTKDEIKQINKLEEKNIRKGKACFEYAKHQFPNAVGLDVSNSGAQIFAALVGNEKALKDTNFCIEFWLKSSTEKKDLYSVVLDKMKKYFKEKRTIKILHELKKIEELKDNTLELEKIEKEKIEKIEKAIPFVEDLFIRDLLKQWVMQFMYSETHHARSTFLAIEIEKQFSEQKEFQDLHSSGDYYTIGRVFSFCFIEAMNEEYSDICILSSKLQKLFSKIFITCLGDIRGYHLCITTQEGGLNAFLNFSKQLKSFIYYSQNGGKSKSKMLLWKDSNVMDINRVVRSIVPNFIHNLDSEIVTEVVFEFDKLNKPIWVIHDCFWVHPNDAELLKQTYYNSFIKCVFESNALENLISANIHGNTAIDRVLSECDRLFPDDCSKKFVDIIKQKNDLYKKLKSGELVCSENILT